MPSAEAYRAEHQSEKNRSALAGIECLAALARDASPDVQGRVAFQLLDMVKQTERLNATSRKCMLHAIMSVQRSLIAQVQASIVSAWYELCHRSSFARLENFPVQCTQALLQIIVNSESSVELRQQSVKFMTTIVDNDNVCQYLGDPVLMRKLMVTDEPSTGVEQIHLWVILLKVLSSESCPHTHALLLEHAACLTRMLSTEDLPIILKPLVRLMKCVHEHDDVELLGDCCEAMLAIFTSPGQVRSLAIEQRFEELIFQVLRIVRRSPDAPKWEKLVVLGIRLLAALAAHDKALQILQDQSFLATPVVIRFLDIPQPSVVGAFISLLRHCGRSDEVIVHIQQKEIVAKVVEHVMRKTDEDIYCETAKLLYCFATSADGLKLLDEQAVEAIFVIVRRGSPQAQEIAIQSIYYLAVEAKTKRSIVRSDMLELLCELARSE